MSALEVKRGHIQGQGMPDGLICDLCRHEYGRNKIASYVVWVLGRPLMRICAPCRKSVREMWEDALS